MIIDKKAIFKATIFGITLFTVYEITKTREEKKYTEVSTPDHPINESEEPKKETKLIDKIKENKIVKKIKRASEKVSEWIVKHESDIDLATKCFSLMASIFTLRSAAIRSNEIKSFIPHLGKDVGDPILPISSSKQQVEILPTIEVKSGDVLVGEWDENGSNMHFTVC